MRSSELSCLRTVDQFRDLAVRSGAQIERSLVMATSQLERGRISLEVKDGEIEVRLRVVGLKLDRLAHFILGAGVPSFAPDGDAEVVVNARILRLQKCRLGERGEAGVEFVLLVVDDPE